MITAESEENTHQHIYNTLYIHAQLLTRWTLMSISLYNIVYALSLFLAQFFFERIFLAQLNAVQRPTSAT